MDREAKTPSEASREFQHLLAQLKAPVLALGPKEEPRAKELLGEVGAEFAQAIGAPDEHRQRALDAIREHLTELERLMSGQQMMFASIRARVVSRHMRASVENVFKALFEILDSVESLIAADTMRQLGIKPKPSPVKQRIKAPKTYAKAQEDIMTGLRKNGWAVVPHLKIPHATSPQGDVRLWFKPQAIYMSYGPGLTNFGSARSTWSADYRGTPTEEMVKELERHAASVSKRYQRASNG